MRAVHVLLIGAFTSGCGSCAQKATELGVEKMTGTKVDSEKGTVTFKSGNTSMALGAGQQMPANLPIKPPADATVVMTTEDEGGKQVIFSTAQSAKTLGEEWEKALRAKGLKVERADQSFEATELVNLAFTGEQEGGLSVMRDSSSDPAITTVTLRWKPAGVAK